jgi:hypothetical protein
MRRRDERGSGRPAWEANTLAYSDPKVVQRMGSTTVRVERWEFGKWYFIIAH